MNEPRETSAYAAALVSGYLDGRAPATPAAAVHVMAGACGWMVARCAGALRATERPEELLGAAWTLAHVELDRAGVPDPQTAANGRPGPSATAEYLVAQEAAGNSDHVDKVLTEFLSPDIPGGTAVLARFAAHLLRLLDGEGAGAVLRAAASNS